MGSPRFKQVSLVGKLRHEATSSLKEGEPSFASKTVKIAHQQTFGVLLSELSLDF